MKHNSKKDMKKIFFSKTKFDSLPVKLLFGLIIGIIVGFVVPENIMAIIVSIKNILGQLITFCVPLIIIGFVAPSITRLGNNATKLLGVALLLAYVSSILAALLSMTAGYAIIPSLKIVTNPDGLKSLPKDIFSLGIPQIMPVMSALVISILVGLAAVWSKAKVTSSLLAEFQEIVNLIVRRVIIPILPIFIGLSFSTLAYDGTLKGQLPIFIIVIIIVMLGHYIWLAVLYIVASLYSKKNSLEVLKHYGPAYITAVGTMSSAATLAVSLRCARKATPKFLRDDMVDFGIPLFANIHLCGSVLTEVFFVMTISKVLYGNIPSIGTMVLFCALLAIFAIGAPGVPGGTVMASLGLITGILGFNDAGTALMLTIFALQDSFGTACNVTGDGALTLILSTYADKNKL